LHFGTAKKDALDVLESGSGGGGDVIGVVVVAAAINNFLQASSGTTVDETEDVAVELFDDQPRPPLITRFLSCNHLLPTRPSRLLQCRV